MKICMFGCGSLGANTTINIARRWTGEADFLLVDFDDIARVNLANQPWFDVNVGQRKASVLAAHVYRVTTAKATPIIRKVENAIDFTNEYRRDLKDVNLFIDCFDNIPSRKLTQEISELCKKPILHAGFSETVFQAEWDKKFDLKESKVARAPVCDRRDLATLVVLGAGITEFIATRYFVSKKKLHRILEINGDTLSLW